MLKTGNIFIDFFSQVVIFFPLLPVIIIFFRGVYQKESLIYLVILCLINFTQDMALQTLQIKDITQFSIRHIFSLLEFIVIVQIFKSILQGNLKELVNILAVAILSAVITYYLVKGANEKKNLIELLKDGFIIMLATYSLVRIVYQENLRIFYSAFFWIATGTLFYFVTVLLLDIIEACCPDLKNPFAADKMLLLNIAGVARYFFYTLATLVNNRN
ncbi:MAG: hypothetical protein JST75_15335 [Bacteroidetes bacterium]|nr:hypothetical protein [Bacteroidota bacterium]